MSTTADRALTWAPRVITLAFALGIALFAVEVFGQGRPFGWVLIALVMHLVPSIVVAAIALAAWHYEWFGAVAAGLLTLLYLATKGTALPWYDTIIIAGTLGVVALLYAINAFRHREHAHA